MHVYKPSLGNGGGGSLSYALLDVDLYSAVITGRGCLSVDSTLRIVALLRSHDTYLKVAPLCGDNIDSYVFAVIARSEDESVGARVLISTRKHHPTL